MISIIICSRTQNISVDLSENIKNTTGYDYELLVIDNSKKKYSIFQAYNIGLAACRGTFICFMHDDIFIKTNNWGKIIETIFLTNEQAGLLGVAGGKIKTKMPSTWYESGENVLRLIQHYKKKPKKDWNQGFDNFDTVEVAAVDGVFMVMKRDESVMFDERLKGFHNYDLYLSVKHNILNKKVLVTNEILIEHFSQGNLNKSWYKSTSLFHKLYKNYLPINLNNSKKDLKKIEFVIGSGFVTKLISQKLFKDAFYWWFQIFKLKPNSNFHVYFWKSIIKKII